MSIKSLAVSRSFLIAASVLAFAVAPATAFAGPIVSIDRNTTTTITSVSPEPSTVGDGYVVKVTVSRDGKIGNPSGTVVVSDGTDSCQASTHISVLGGASSHFSCTLTSTTVGDKTLTATYTDTTIPKFFNSSSGTIAHTVLPHRYTVTIDKFIDGVMATVTSAANSAFPMVSSWNAVNLGGAGSGSYALDTNHPYSPNNYEAITSPMNAGSSYTTNESTGNAVVGADCSTGAPFALVGYTTGSSPAEATAGTPSLTVPNFTDLEGNQYVVVWNKDCLAAPTPVSPANGTYTTTANQTSISWSAVTDAAGGITYTYQASNSSDTNPDGSFSAPVYTSAPLSDTSIATNGTPEGTYYWHIQAKDADGNLSSWSTAWKIVVDDTPPTVTVTPMPADGILHGSETFDITVHDNNPLDPSKNGNIWVYLYDNDGSLSSGANVYLSNGTGSFMVNTKDLNDGLATLDVGELFDAAGNPTVDEYHPNGIDSYFHDYTIDNTGPVITILGDNPLALHVGDIFTDPGATALDAVDGVIMPTSVSNVDTTHHNAYSVVYTATDNQGNTSTATRVVNVSDVNAPVITVPEDITAEATGPSGAQVDYGTVTANDNDDGSVAVTCDPVTPSTFAIGLTTVHCSATDSSGNVGHASFNVTVQDTTKPAVTGLTITQNPVNLANEHTVTATFTATDAVGVASTDATLTDGTLTVPGAVMSDGSGHYTAIFDASALADGTLTASVTATDAAHNTSTAVTATTEKDATAPVITLNGSNPMLIVKGSGYEDPGATADDGSTVTNDGLTSVDANTDGSYTETYSATDGAGNTGTTTRSVQVVDSPTCVLSFSPSSVVAGDSSTLSWSCVSTADTVTIDNGIGSEPANGSTTVSIGTIGTYTYNLSTVSVVDGTTPVTASATLDVTNSGGGGSGDSGTSGSSGSGSGGSPITPSLTPPTFTTNATTPNTGGQVLGAEAFNFTKNLWFRMPRNTDVSELQSFLIAEGYSIPSGVTTWFGTETLAAVKAFQQANNIPVTGFVGPLTRAILNKGIIPTTPESGQ